MSDLQITLIILLLSLPISLVGSYYYMKYFSVTKRLGEYYKPISLSIQREDLDIKFRPQVSTQGNRLVVKDKEGRVKKIIGGTGSYSCYELCKNPNCKCRPKEKFVSYCLPDCQYPEEFILNEDKV